MIKNDDDTMRMVMERLDSLENFRHDFISAIKELAVGNTVEQAALTRMSQISVCNTGEIMRHMALLKAAIGKMVLATKREYNLDLTSNWADTLEVSKQYVKNTKKK